MNQANFINAAKEAFADFLDEYRYSAQQIRFVEMIIDRLVHNGLINPAQLYEPPFTSIHFEGVDGAFGDAAADALISRPASTDSAAVGERRAAALLHTGIHRR